MLFISRHIGSFDFEVIDTDDDTAEVATRSDLTEAFDTLHLDIKGVTRGSAARSYVLDPYQDLSTMTTLQTKTKVISNVDVVVYKSFVTMVRWSVDRIGTPVSVRLSDFGVDIADCVMSCSPGSGRHVVTLVFDDKLQSITEWSFRMDVKGWSSELAGLRFLGVVFDLRELTKDDMAEDIYRQLDAYAHNSFDCVLDVEERKARMKSLFSNCGE